jgi:hypothetical protein
MNKGQKRVVFWVPAVLLGIPIVFAAFQSRTWHHFWSIVLDLDANLVLTAFVVWLIYPRTNQTPPEDDGIAGEFWKHRE